MSAVEAEDLVADSNQVIAGLYEDLYRQLELFADSILHNRALAEDVVQTVFVQFIQVLDPDPNRTLQGAVIGDTSSSALTTWLIETTRHEALKMQRRRRDHRLVGDDVLANIPTAQLNPEAQLLMNEKLRKVVERFKKLNPRQQEALWLRVATRKTNVEIGKMMAPDDENPLRTVNALVKRAKKRLEGRPGSL